MKSFKRYLELMKATFMISAFTLGGGYVIVPLLRQKFVEEKGWIVEDEVLNLIAVAQSAPGAMAVNASFLLGYEVAGIFGALATIVGTILPPVIIISIISVFYSIISGNAWFILILSMMRLAVIAIIIDVVYDLGKNIWQQKQLLPILLMLIAFIALAIFKVSIIILLVGCGITGFLYQFLTHRHHRLAKEEVPHESA